MGIVVKWVMVVICRQQYDGNGCVCVYTYLACLMSSSSIMYNTSSDKINNVT